MPPGGHSAIATRRAQCQLALRAAALQQEEALSYCCYHLDVYQKANKVKPWDLFIHSGALGREQKTLQLYLPAMA